MSGTTGSTIERAWASGRAHRLKAGAAAFTAVFSAAIASLAAAPVVAQQPHSPYAADASAEVKTLSREEVDALRSGAGMGLARPAEMNGYPGPRHVLELADSLDLTADQRARTEAVFAAMEAEAVSLGRSVIAAEARLDSLFAASAVPAPALEAAVRAAALSRSELRWTHLRAHLRMREILTEHQVHAYDRLRGYGADHGH